MNKSDLPAAFTQEALQAYLPSAPLVTVSAAEPASLAPLKELLRQRATVTDQLALTQPRHLDAARRAAAHLHQAAETLSLGLPVDLCTVDLTAASAALGEITGDQVEEKLLDSVFNQFCVGK